jgi:predicted dehydrogenase
MTIANRFTRLPGKEWYREQAKSGGQVVEMVTHQLDLLRCVVGEIATVYAAAGRRIATSAESDVFDVAAATLTFANGAVGTLSTNLVSAHGTPAHARGIHIFAEGRTVSILGHEGERRTVHTVDAGGRTEQTFEDVSMRAQDRAFVAAVQERRPELVKSTYESGMRTLAVTLAHQRSAELGQPVGVDGLLGGG